MRVALKVDVGSVRGARDGVPRLLELLDQYQVRASFCLSLGPDRSGRDPVGRWTTVGPGRGLANLYGLLWPAPRIARAASSQLRAIQAAGHELGLAGFDAAAWGRQAGFADAAWIGSQLRSGLDAFRELFAAEPLFFAATGWQINPHLLALEGGLGFRFASDTRGRYPFYPVNQGVRSTCPQVPTTLPTLQEMLKSPGIDREQVHEHLYVASRRVLPAGHLYSARAEVEGLEYLDVMEKLIVMWKGQEGSIRPMGNVLTELDPASLPEHQVGWAEVPGREEHLATQGIEVPR